MPHYTDPENIIDPAKLAALEDASFRAPEEVGVAEGWRVWQVKIELPAFGMPPKLESVTHNYYWAPRQKARAICERGCGSSVPGEHCTCGFYSAKTLEHLRSMHYPNYDLETGYVAIAGKMANWGKVIEGSQGWRSEYSYPMRLYVPFEAFRLAKPLEVAYGVNVTLLNILDKSKTPPEEV
jgi:hypothetical protein